MLQAVLFDLDGTLLQVHTDNFMNEYLKEIARAAAPVVDPQRFTRALLDSTGVMLVNRDPVLTNAEVFWNDFRSRTADCHEALEPLLDDFYANKYKELVRVTGASPLARRAVQAALDHNLRIAVATNPVFPRSAIYDRLAWAGVADLPWELVTSYEEMHYCKPYPEYYREIAYLLELPPEDCIMIGNDAAEDMAAAAAGMRTCLVTDYLINPDRVHYQERVDWYGTLDELCLWLAGAGWEQGRCENMAVERVRRYVKQFDAGLEPLVFTEATSTVEEAARALGVEPGMIAKTLLFRAGDHYGLFVVAGDVRVSTKKVKALLGGKPRMATPQEVEEITGYRVGGVCPFALAGEVPIYLDASMQRFDVIYPAAGTAHSALPITFKKLEAITRGTVVDC
ncbi:YbaK/EbsC family protein [Desulfoscipio sp. XC116]|uniref:YbaK/EbsC family protein n=1 Tax=Desulfoscipio sp. XC116 TaxID=3144975 RepID=UPI00325AEE12